tara:strand:+ start:1433 stop:3445 length:2013 start_codon:yes stop_codon:yes gene_type:complete
MAYFKIIQFGGIAPQISPRLLNDQAAQTASNINLESQRLTPITDDTVINPKSSVTTLSNSNRLSIYKYTDTQWLQFDEDVDVVPGPVAGDTNNTVYWTGQSYPRMGRSTDVIGGSVYPNSHFRLGVAAPTAAPTVALASATNINATLTTVNGSSVLTVTTASNHGAAIGQYVTLSNFATQNAVEDETINQSHKIVTVPSATTLTIEVDQAATGASTSSSITDGASFGALTDQLPDYSTSYVYTFVSVYGEEGPPSAASTVVTTDDNASVALSNLQTSTSKSNSNLGSGAVKRIYRSNTGSNTTAFQFVAEIAMAATTYTDTTNNEDLAEVIPSTYHIAPPDDDTSTYPDGPLKGLTALPNGVLAGFTGKRLCFSEPYLPYAWPISYRLTLEDPIVGIAAVGNGLIVTTESNPYLVAGTDPASMSAMRMETPQPCLSKTSMVDMGTVVLYAGPEGLVAAAGSEVRTITEGLISPDQWQSQYYPSTINATLWKGRYLAFYNTGSGFGGFIFDPRSGTKSFTTLTASALIRGTFTDPDDGNAYLIIANQIKKFQGGTTDQTYTWKSKDFVPPKPTSMGFVKVDAEAFPVTVKVYGDGTLFYTGTIALSGTQHSVSGSYVNTAGSSVNISSTNIPEPILRLPPRVFKDFAIEVSSAKVVNEVCIAESIDELRGI